MEGLYPFVRRQGLEGRDIFSLPLLCSLVERYPRLDQGTDNLLPVGFKKNSPPTSKVCPLMDLLKRLIYHIKKSLIWDKELFAYPVLKKCLLRTYARNTFLYASLPKK